MIYCRNWMYKANYMTTDQYWWGYRLCLANQSRHIERYWESTKMRKFHFVFMTHLELTVMWSGHGFFFVFEKMTARTEGQLVYIQPTNRWNLIRNNQIHIPSTFRLNNKQKQKNNTFPSNLFFHKSTKKRFCFRRDSNIFSGPTSTPDVKFRQNCIVQTNLLFLLSPKLKLY